MRLFGCVTAHMALVRARTQTHPMRWCSLTSPLFIMRSAAQSAAFPPKHSRTQKHTREYFAPDFISFAHTHTHTFITIWLCVRCGPDDAWRAFTRRRADVFIVGAAQPPMPGHVSSCDVRCEGRPDLLNIKVNYPNKTAVISGSHVGNHRPGNRRRSICAFRLISAHKR